MDHTRFPGHELGGERRQPFQPVMSEAGLQRDGLPIHMTKLGKAGAHANPWRIDVVRRGRYEKPHFRPSTCGLGAGTRSGQEQQAR